MSVIQDENWLKTEFVTTVAQRGTSVLNARKAGSAASAANAVIDTVKSIMMPTPPHALCCCRTMWRAIKSIMTPPPNDWHSVSVCSDGSYGIEAGLICSFPVRSDGKKLQIVQGLELNEFSRGKITASVNELKSEKAMAVELGLAK
jgi:malate dehydrogenase